MSSKRRAPLAKPAAEDQTRKARSAAALARLQRLCGSLDLDVFAGSIIVDLLDRLEAAQRELDRRSRGR